MADRERQAIKDGAKVAEHIKSHIISAIGQIDEGRDPSDDLTGAIQHCEGVVRNAQLAVLGNG